MFNDDLDDGFDPNADFHCDSCGETLFEASHCTECHEGRCMICGVLIAKGQPFATGSQNDVFCIPCDQLAAQESVGEIAERLGNAVPEPIEEPETGALALALASQACSAHRQPPEVESVGALAQGPSVWSAPVHATTAPPEFGLVVGSDDDAVGDTVTTVSRADGGDDDAEAEAPAVEAKSAHGF